MPISHSDAQLVLDIIGVFVFALSGGMVAVRKHLDLFGILVLAGVAALGGGILRDVLLDLTPPVGVSDWRLISAAAAGGLVVFLHPPGVSRVGRLVKILDAVGLAAFTVSGAVKAVTQPGIPPIAAILIGVITAIGGGVMRDVLAGEVPEVLRRELYAIPAALGATLVVVAALLGHLTDVVVWSVAMLVFAVRMLAVWLDLNVPTKLHRRKS